MKRISREQANLITSLAAEGKTNYSPAAIEKDLHLTEALRALQEINSNDEISFGGGTSLVKGYGAINRMSEDLDFKINFEQEGGKAATRNRLREVKGAIQKSLLAIGLERISVDARNENSYMVFEFQYESYFPRIVSLRPFIKIEVTKSPLYTATESRQIQSILYRDAQLIEDVLTFPCVSLNQTLAEKTLSFLRKYISIKENRKREYDNRIVRHIHDVGSVSRSESDLDEMVKIFQKAVSEDSERFGNTGRDFKSEIYTKINESYRQIQRDINLEEDYKIFVADLHAGPSLEFPAALDNFLRIANLCLQED